MTRTPLGLKICNPANIRYSDKTQWKGQIGSMQGFVIFSDMHYGVRAAAKLLRNYITKYDCNTIEKIINRWAPPSENPTSAYVRNVCIRTGFLADEILHDDAPTIRALLFAITQQELGQAIELADLNAGVDLAFV